MTINFEQHPSKQKEKIQEFRKRASEKIVRFMSYVTFDTNTIHIADIEDVEPEKYEQDVAFASYEPNLRESHYQAEKETREYHKQKMINTARLMGAYISMLPGMGYVEGVYQDARFEANRAKRMKALYKQEHGTIASKTVAQWKKGLGKVNKLKEQRAVINDR